MTPAEIVTFITNKLHLTLANVVAGTEYPNLLPTLNNKMYDLCGHISKKNLGYFGVYNEYFNLVANQREYALPDDILNHLVMVEIMLDGSTWQRVKIKPLNDLKELAWQEAEITNQYSNLEPYAFIFKKTLFILSGTISAVSHGLRIWYIAFPQKIPLLSGTTELAITTNVSGTLSIGFPLQFHELLMRAAIIDYKEENEIPLVGREQLFDMDLKEKIDQLSPMNLDEEFKIGLPKEDGSEF